MKKSTSSSVAVQHLTIEGAAERHNVSVWFLRTQIYAGRLKAAKAGRRYVMAIAELDRFFAELVASA